MQSCIILIATDAFNSVTAAILDGWFCYIAGDVIHQCYRCYVCIDGHTRWNSNRRLTFIICHPRKTNFCFPFPLAANKRKFHFPLVLFSGNTVYLNNSIYTIHIYINTENGTMLPFQMENGSTGDFPIFLNPLPIVHRAKWKVFFVRLLTQKQTEVIHLQLD